MDAFKASAVSFATLALVYLFMGVFMLIVSYKRKPQPNMGQVRKMQMCASFIFCLCMVGIIVTSILWLCEIFHDDFTSCTNPLAIFLGLGAEALVCYEVAPLYWVVRFYWRWWHSWLCLSWLCTFTCMIIVIIFLAMFNYMSPRTRLLAIVLFDINFLLIVYLNLHVWKNLQQCCLIHTFEAAFWLWNFSVIALAVLLARTIDMKYGLLICLSACVSLACICNFILECMRLKWRTKRQGTDSTVSSATINDARSATQETPGSDTNPDDSRQSINQYEEMSVE